jgi:hypothetical protein
MADLTPQFDEILDLFGRLGVEVRMERLGGQGGGLCTLRDSRVVFVDIEADMATRVERCLTALAQVPEVDNLYLPPAIREEIEHRKGRSR